MSVAKVHMVAVWLALQAHVCECFEAALDPAAADVDDAAPLPCVDPEVVQLQEEVCGGSLPPAFCCRG